MTAQPDPSNHPDVTHAISENDVVSLLQRLVGIPSVTGGEREVALVLADELRALGVEPVTDEFEDGRLNVYGHLAGREDGPVILLAGHIDTVNIRGWDLAWPAENARSDPFAGAIIDGRVWGRGTADMKGGIAACITAVAGLLKAGIDLDAELHFAFVCDEESGEPGSGTSAGVKAYVRWLEQSGLRLPEFAIYAEPTDLTVGSCNLGFMIGVITITGRGAYFSFPWQGRSAIRDAHILLAELFAYDAAISGQGRHELLGRAGLLVTEIRGGESVSVPESCEISFIRWLLPDENIETVGAEIQDVVRRQAIERGIEAELTFTAPRDSAIGGKPFEVDLVRVPTAELFLDSIRAHVPDVRIAGLAGWSEAPILGGLGIPTVYFGAGDISLCHTPQENVLVDDLVAATRSIGSFLVRVAAGGGA